MVQYIHWYLSYYFFALIIHTPGLESNAIKCQLDAVYKKVNKVY